MFLYLGQGRQLYFVFILPRIEGTHLQRWTRREYIHVGSCRPSMASNGPAQQYRSLTAGIQPQSKYWVTSEIVAGAL
ncbi:MAG: hypothetical protein V2I26_08705, partial [Halieaceae bacterium]|nr:hypothetical protein [Halieaceae bacterium]